MATPVLVDESTTCVSDHGLSPGGWRRGKLIVGGVVGIPFWGPPKKPPREHPQVPSQTAGLEALCYSVQRNGLGDNHNGGGLETIGGVVATPAGQSAMMQRLAEQYVGELSAMSKNSQMIIVPDKPNDVSGVVTTALALGKQVAAKA